MGTLVSRVIHVGLEQLVGVTTAIFRLIHGRVSIIEQRTVIGSVVGIEADPDTGGNTQLMVTD